eukprot:jgi/Bigna1/64483/fgenesh1_kg.76_\
MLRILTNLIDIERSELVKEHQSSTLACWQLRSIDRRINRAHQWGGAAPAPPACDQRKKMCIEAAELIAHVHTPQNCHAACTR